MTDEVKVLNFLNEVKILEQVEHKNIVKFFGICVWPLWIVTEYIDGEDLDKALKGAPLQRKMALIRDLIDGVQYLHSHSPPVLHKDLKPQNCMVSREGRLIIIDLGLSGLTSFKNGMWEIQTSSLKKQGGTFLYKAPEHFFEDKSITLAADVWSVAIVINEILEESLPCGYYGWTRLKRHFGFFKYPLADQMTLLKLLLWKCLQIDYTLRPTITHISQHFQVLEGLFQTHP